DANRPQDNAAAPQRVFRRERRRVGQRDGRVCADGFADPAPLPAAAVAHGLGPRGGCRQAIGLEYPNTSAASSRGSPYSTPKPSQTYLKFPDQPAWVSLSVG